MTFKTLFCALCLVACAQLAQSASRSFALSTNIDAPANIGVYETAQTASEFYALNTVNPFSAGLPFPFTFKRAHAFMHRDTRDGTLSIGLMFNRYRQAAANARGRVALTVSGANAGTVLSVGDDPQGSSTDVYPVGSPNGDYVFDYDLNRTDGFMISGFEGLDFTVSIALTDRSSLTSYALYNDDGSTLVFSSNTSEFVFVSEQVDPIPLPASAGLLLAGIAGLGVFAYRGKRKPRPI